MSSSPPGSSCSGEWTPQPARSKARGSVPSTRSPPPTSAGSGRNSFHDRGPGRPRGGPAGAGSTRCSSWSVPQRLFALDLNRRGGRAGCSTRAPSLRASQGVLRRRQSRRGRRGCGGGKVISTTSSNTTVASMRRPGAKSGAPSWAIPPPANDDDGADRHPRQFSWSTAAAKWACAASSPRSRNTGKEVWARGAPDRMPTCGSVRGSTRSTPRIGARTSARRDLERHDDVAARRRDGLGLVTSIRRPTAVLRTSNPGVWNPNSSGRQQVVAAIFARDPDTGDAIWAYQSRARRLGLRRRQREHCGRPDGRRVPRKLLVHFDRNGFAYPMDRRTGEV